MKRIGYITCIREKRNAYRVIVSKPEGNRPHGRPRNKWESSIKMNLIKQEGTAWTGSI
jgi:hypothetical protein